MSLSTSASRIICLICVLSAVGTAQGAAISSRLQIRPQQLRIAQCRQLCYRQALTEPTPPALCRARPDCFMCHDYCRVLAVAEWSLASSMCADRVFCSQGCRIACAFHQLSTFLARDDEGAGNAVSKT